MGKIKTFENFESDKPYQTFCIFNTKTDKFWGKPRNMKSVKDNQWINNVPGENYEGWINWYNHKQAEFFISSHADREDLLIMHNDEVDKMIT